MKLIIEDDEGHRTVVPFMRDELSIGRTEENVIRLLEKNVSRKHARLLRANGKFFVEDLKSFTGVRVNGEKIHGKAAVDEGDLIQISEYDLILQYAPGERPAGEGGEDDDSTPARRALLSGEDEEPTAVSERKKETAVIRMEDVSGTGQAQARDLALAEQPRLVCLEGDLAGLEFPLRRSVVGVGRTADNDVALDDPSVSRYHCKLFLEGDAWKLLDNRSAHGVHVNGEHYAVCRVKPGDLIEVGDVKLRFVAPGQDIEQAAQAGPRPRSRASLLWVAAALIALAAVGAYLWTKKKAADEAARAAAARLDAIQRELTAASAAMRGHRWAEALQRFEAAGLAGAAAEELRGARTASDELRTDADLKKLEAALAASRFDAAKEILDKTGAEPGWTAAQIRDRSPAVLKGYTDDHLAKSEAMRRQSPETCADEADLVLAIDPANARARELLAACSRPSHSRPAKPQRPAVPAVAIGDFEESAQRLVAEGNQRLLAQDFVGAVARFQKALALKPDGRTLASLYRSMGIALTRRGDVEGGAHYYRLYLPLCTDPKEKAYLEKTLQEYERRK